MVPVRLPAARPNGLLLRSSLCAIVLDDARASEHAEDAHAHGLEQIA